MHSCSEMLDRKFKTELSLVLLRNVSPKDAADVEKKSAASTFSFWSFKARDADTSN